MGSVVLCVGMQGWEFRGSRRGCRERSSGVWGLGAQAWGKGGPTLGGGGGLGTGTYIYIVICIRVHTLHYITLHCIRTYMQPLSIYSVAKGMAHFARTSRT